MKLPRPFVSYWRKHGWDQAILLVAAWWGSFAAWLVPSQWWIYPVMATICTIGFMAWTYYDGLKFERDVARRAKLCRQLGLTLTVGGKPEN